MAFRVNNRFAEKFLLVHFYTKKNVKTTCRMRRSIALRKAKVVSYRFFCLES